MHLCTHAELIDGKAIAEQIRQELKAEVAELKAKYGKVGCVRDAPITSTQCLLHANVNVAVRKACGRRSPGRPAAVQARARPPPPLPAPHWAQPRSDAGARKAPSRAVRARALTQCWRAQPPQVPGLAVVLVGERKDSQTYVRNKKKACEEVRDGRAGRPVSFGWGAGAGEPCEEPCDRLAASAAICRPSSASPWQPLVAA